MAKELIKSWRGLNWIQIGGCYVRKDCIEMVDETTPREIRLRTVSGIEFNLQVNEAKEILAELNFNDK